MKDVLNMAGFRLGLEILNGRRFDVFLLVFALSVLVSCNADSACEIQGYDVKNLTSGEYWEVGSSNVSICQLPAQSSSKSLNANDSINCTLRFALCKQLPSQADPCKSAGSCLMNGTGSAFYSLGQYTSGNPFIPIGKSGFQVEFHNGAKPNGSSCSLSTLLVFHCKKDVLWLPSNHTAPSANITYVKDNCTYILNMNYAGACYAEAPPNPKKDAGLSTGSVLVIVFFMGVLVYFVLGMACQYTAGARGIELIPNYEFWCEFPALVLDGCVFFFRFVTCRTSTGLTYDTL